MSKESEALSNQDVLDYVPLSFTKKNRLVRPHSILAIGLTAVEKIMRKSSKILEFRHTVDFSAISRSNNRNVALYDQSL